MLQSRSGPWLLRRALQAQLTLTSLIMLWFALNGLFFGAAPHIAGPPPPALDNHSRFVAGIYLLYPFLIWWIIPSIERHAVPIRLMAVAMACGGIGRLISLMQLGSGDAGQLFSMGVELCYPLVFIPWQHAVARHHRDAVKQEM